MSEIVAAIVGALIGSATTLLWEAVLRPRRERLSVAAAFNAEVAFMRPTIGRYLNAADTPPIPIDFHAPTTVYQSLSDRLGELPADLSFLLATLYSALEEANALPGHYEAVSRRRESPFGEAMNTELARLAERFQSLLRSVDASSRIAHKSLAKMTAGVRIENGSASGASDI
jgi:uncharacterized membrane protein YccC